MEPVMIAEIQDFGEVGEGVRLLITETRELPGLSTVKLLAPLPLKTG